MTTPQAGIFALGTRTHHLLEFDVDASVSRESVGGAIKSVLDPDVVGGSANVVVGFGAALWGRLATDFPTGLEVFTEVRGTDGHVAPSTQHDIWIWIHGDGADELLDASVAATAALGDVATLAEETSCFVYHDSRDLTGFIDGSANPSPVEAPEVACIPQGAPGAGGSHVIAQRWVHDLDKFWTLDVADQERVIGRTKPDSVELSEDVLPATAHIARAELLDANGEERPIYRRSIPYGTVAERGLYFLAFSAERDRFDGMLGQMFGTADDGVRDHLIDYSEAVTGSYYFAPSLESLAAIVDI